MLRALPRLSARGAAAAAAAAAAAPSQESQLFADWCAVQRAPDGELHLTECAEDVDEAIRIACDLIPQPEPFRQSDKPPYTVEHPEDEDDAPDPASIMVQAETSMRHRNLVQDENFVRLVRSCVMDPQMQRAFFENQMVVETLRRMHASRAEQPAPVPAITDGSESRVHIEDIPTAKPVRESLLLRLLNSFKSILSALFAQPKPRTDKKQDPKQTEADAESMYQEMLASAMLFAFTALVVLMCRRFGIVAK
eukprot:jgi/Chlat1/9046/Chrsp94S08310